MLFYFNISYHIIFYLSMAKHTLSYFIKSNQIFKKMRSVSIRSDFFSCRVERRESIEGQKNPEPVSDLFFEVVQIYLVNSDLGMYL